MTDPNEFFREVTVRIGSSLDVGRALENLFDYLRRVFPADGMSLNYRGMDGGIYSVGLAGEAPGALGLSMATLNKLDEREEALLMQKAREHDLVFGDVVMFNWPYPTYFRHYLVSRLGEHSAMPSLLSLRLDIQGEPIGGVMILNNRDEPFTNEHCVLLHSVKEPIAIAMSNARRYLELKRLRDNLDDDNRAMQRELERLSGNQVIGGESGLRQVMELVRQVAPMKNPVLLLGETGTGKEVIANAVHMASPRRNNPMVRVQCGAIPDSLLDSELFGHEKGAFTGAVTGKRGRFERAEGGTIFLDEIGELTHEAQVKLLRVLQEHEIERLGGSRTIPVDVRVIAATHRNLELMVTEGRFREDLWYRLNVFPIHLPPLRERREDIPALIAYFLGQKSRALGLEVVPALAAEDVERLTAYRWPGNVRELQNIIERALIVSGGNRLVFPRLGSYGDGIASPASPGGGQPLETLEQMTGRHIRRALAETRGKVEGKRGAAELLGLNPSTLRAKMRKLKIPFGRDAECG